MAYSYAHLLKCQVLTLSHASGLTDVVVVATSSHARIWGEGSTNHSVAASVFFLFFFKVEISSRAKIERLRPKISPHWLSELR